MKRVVLHIDRLALKGYARADAHAIVERLRAELATRLAESGTVPGLAALPSYRERLELPIAGATTPPAVGTRLAAGIADAIAGCGKSATP